MYDVIIVGAGPAGLNAALVLGRCRRRVLVCDSGRPRNACSQALHGFLSRDGIKPSALLELGREQLAPYETVTLRQAVVEDARATSEGFEVTLDDGSRYACRKLLLATGVVDELPDVEGFEAIYGTTAHHCPYCDGWEHRDAPLAVYGPGGKAVGLALELLQWSRRLVLCTDGPAGEIEPHVRERLNRYGVRIREERVRRFEGEGAHLARVTFEEGPAEEVKGLFFNVGQRLHSDLAVRLGCRLSEKGTVETGAFEATSVPGVFVAGDASRSVQMVAVAVAEGTEAAVAINTALLKDDFA